MTRPSVLLFLGLVAVALGAFESDLDGILDAFYVCKDFYYYKSGVYSTDCDPNNPDYEGGHAVTIVGYGTSPQGVPYWLVRNSYMMRPLLILGWLVLAACASKHHHEKDPDNLLDDTEHQEFKNFKNRF
ncbi:unnamed protein product, partial [Mesorhabditis spiculigera]